MEASTTLRHRRKQIPASAHLAGRFNVEEDVDPDQESSGKSSDVTNGTCGSAMQTVSEESLGGNRALICLQSKRGFGRPSFMALPEKAESLADVRKQLVQKKKALWEDSAFKADVGALGYNNKKPKDLPGGIVWKRPGEIVGNPRFITEGATRFDIVQGRLQDCWFISAMSVITMNPLVLSRVLDTQQGFTASSGYCGAFSFRFFSGGEWKEVVVDDRLPTYRGRLLFLRSTDENEFWPSLMEKAFAKMLGCYDALNIGTFNESASYFGAMTENFNIRGSGLDGFSPEIVKERLLEAGRRGSMCGAAIYDLGVNSNSGKKFGLPVGHEYALTGFEEERVRVRNPWGESTEWVGQHSRPDGEFYMDWDSFMQHFHQVQVAHFSLDSLAHSESHQGEAWAGRAEVGEWGPRTAGGCTNYKTFAKNPQYQLTVPGQGSKPVTLLVALDQIHAKRLNSGMEMHAIGFSIYRSREGEGLSREELSIDNKDCPWVADSGVFTFEKQVVGRYQVPPGTYTIIPSTYFPNKKACFFLRVWYSTDIMESLSFGSIS